MLQVLLAVLILKYYISACAVFCMLDLASCVCPKTLKPLSAVCLNTTYTAFLVNN